MQSQLTIINENKQINSNDLTDDEFLQSERSCYVCEKELNNPEDKTIFYFRQGFKFVICNKLNCWRECEYIGERL